MTAIVGVCLVAWMAEVILSLVRQECWHSYKARRGRRGLAGGGDLAYAARGTKRKAGWRRVATRRKREGSTV